jgi:hypothetical protein
VLLTRKTPSLLAFRFNSVSDSSDGIGRVNPIPFHKSSIRRVIKEKIINLDIEEKTITRGILQNILTKTD